MRLRGAASLFTVAILFLVGDLVQRIIVAPLIRLNPRSRDGVLQAWLQAWARIALGIVRGVGGARIAALPSITGREGVLILMNHQSLLDIPIAVRATRGRYPAIVTRKRYARGIPLVSFMLRLYEFPLVEPGARSREQLDQLAAIARASDRPLMIFPEGGRTRDGEIRDFRKGGLESILAQRTWEVHVLVGDGFWQCARLADYVAKIAAVRGRVEHAGPFSFDPDRDEVAAFAGQMRTVMCETLDRMRTAAPADR